MKPSIFALFLVVFTSASFGLDPRILKVNPEDRCTTIAVGKGGTVDGSTMLSYNADCAECDWRLNKVDAKDWPSGSMRPIYLLTGQC